MKRRRGDTLLLFSYVIDSAVEKPMSTDFQVVSPVESIPLSEITLIQGMTPKTLDVRGSDFRAVDEVLINQIPSPDVVVLNKNRLLAQVPESLQLDYINSVSVFSTRLTLTRRSLVKFVVADTPNKVRGITRLVQLFLKILMTTPGRDIFAPRVGGGLLNTIGKTWSMGATGNVVSNAIISVSQTTKQIMALQGRDPRIPLDERLLSAKVVGADFIRAEAALLMQVEIVSQAGRRALVNTEL